MEKIVAPRGTKDVLPVESGRWRNVEHRAAVVAGLYGYEQIRFPTFEHTELFVRGVGDTTDVVQKEMYTFEDRGGRSLTLRPEGTASVVRAGIEHGLFAGALPLKVFYIAPNFRYEKPQAGRLREHHQFGVECFGASGPEADVEVISLAYAFLQQVGIEDVLLHLNSIGCPICREAYRQKLLAFLNEHANALCHNCRERMIRNPLRALDCKEEQCRAITSGAPLLRDSLCEDCLDHHTRVQTSLKQRGITFMLDDRIVRGLDYYTRTVFEFVTDTIGAQGTVLGGGRYDGLVETLGGPKIAGCGFGCGLERILMVQDAAGVACGEERNLLLFMAIAGEAGSPADVAGRLLVNGLRMAGTTVEQDLCGRSLKAQLKHADRLGAKYVMVIGETEVGTAQASLKRMSDGHTFPCALDTNAISRAIREDYMEFFKHSGTASTSESSSVLEF